MTDQVIQGDVMLIRVMDIPEGTKSLKTNKITIAHGESGNAHVIESNAVFLEDAINELDLGWGLPLDGAIVVTADTQLVHVPTTEKAKKDSHHDPVKLRPGIWRRVLQAEENYEARAAAPLPRWMYGD